MTSVFAPSGLVLFSPDFRVKLSLPTREDDAAIAALRALPSVRQHMPPLPVLSSEQMAAQRELRSQDPSILDVVISVRKTPLLKPTANTSSSTGTTTTATHSSTSAGDEGSETDEEDGNSYVFAGVTGIFNYSPEHLCGELGLIIHPSFQGQGLTTPVFYTLFNYLFNEHNFHRILMETSTENTAMNGWFTKVGGSRLEGTRIKALRKENDEWMDMNSYAILEEEWAESVKERLERKMGMGVPKTW